MDTANCVKNCCFACRLNAASVGATLNVPPAPGVVSPPPGGHHSPTDSLRRFVAVTGRTGCNGTAAAGAASRLVNAAVASIDDTLNDVPAAIRKKYPFELEKAIHNVKFIQHHLQRQDEYNTVKTLNAASKSWAGHWKGSIRRSIETSRIF